MRHWHRLSSEVVNALSLKVLKVSLDGALNNLVLWEVSLPMARGLERDYLKSPFQSKPFYSLSQGLPTYERHGTSLSKLRGGHENAQRLENLSCGETLRVGIVQPGGEDS